MSETTRIQLCGRLAVRIAGERIEQRLPGRQGRIVLAHLVLHRSATTPREELVAALWGAEAPAAADSALAALLSKLRAALGRDLLQGRSELRLLLPPAAWVDVEAATEGAHRAESAVALGEFARAWGPARVALHTAEREFLPGCESPWVDSVREHMLRIRLRALEAVATSSLGLGGPELASAERSARALVAAAPFRESGHRALMETLAARGNAAEALLVYDRLRRLLRDELGAAPSAATQELHHRLLATGR